MTQRTFTFAGVPELIDEPLARRLAWGGGTNESMRSPGRSQRACSCSPRGGSRHDDATPHSKPHPGPLLEGARQLSLEPGRCNYVRDDERDVIADKAAAGPAGLADWGCTLQANGFRLSTGGRY